MCAFETSRSTLSESSWQRATPTDPCGEPPLPILALLATGTSAIATSLSVGFASIPTPVSFFEHLALGLMIRAAYKGMGGFDWADWSLTSAHADHATPTPEAVPHAGFTADATS